MNFDLRLSTDTLRNGVMVMIHMDVCTDHITFAKNIVHLSLAIIKGGVLQTLQMKDDPAGGISSYGEG